MTGHVYALRAGDHVKIGTTAGPIAARMNELATGCPYPIACVGWQVGGPSLEAALHRYFAAHRTHNEWFDFWPIADAIERLLPRKLGAFGEPVPSK
jgi:Meiotically Up-regulated Gene 113 (MUG113) protein